MKPLTDFLAQQRAASLYRERGVLSGPQGVEINLDGRPVMAFCSNDYLGLANHPEVVAALQEGARRYGAGSGAAHLISGHSEAHHELERELAVFTGRPRALLFSTGYMANLGVLSALMGRGDTVFEDRLNHASLVDGARLSQARLRRYPHGDTDTLKTWLSRPRDGDTLIASDGVFSMDGDLAPVGTLAQLARGQRAWLLIDDAHGLGVLGDGGRGSMEHWSCAHDDGVIIMGTLGKALGTFGAFVAGGDDLIEYLIQRARTYIYTTALPPAVAHATRTSLRLIREEGWRRDHLNGLITRLRSGLSRLGLTLPAALTPIQPVVVDDADRALRLSRELLRGGVLIPAIRPPTVPKGGARLRITLSAAHQASHVDRLIEALERLL